MVTAVSLYLVIGVLLLVAAGAGYAYSNFTRRRAQQVLRAIEEAIAGEGSIMRARWTSKHSIHLDLKLNSGIFRRASLKIDFEPRSVFGFLKPKEADETLTFQADLDEPPPFNLEVGSQSCWGRSRPGLDLERGEWDFVEAEPLVLSTNEQLDRDASGTLSALIAARSQDFMNLRFQPRSPHFAASLPLEMLPKLAVHNPSLFGVLNDVAVQAISNKH